MTRDDDDDRRRCPECAHHRAGRCGNYRKAGLFAPELGELAAMLQRCPGFAPILRRRDDADEIARHVETLQRLSGRHERAEYLETLSRRDAAIAEATKAEFLRRWEARQSARRRAAERADA